MAGNSGTLKSALEEWLEQNFSTGYKSCVKINGRPILPPVMSEERRIEMRRLRDMAVEVESSIARRKGNSVHEDCAGGEAMYEGTLDELHFANSLPTSLTGNVEASVQSESDVQNNQQSLLLKTTNDMLKEFDPLAEENQNDNALHPNQLLVLDSNDNAVRMSCNDDNIVSKPSSTESSVALSYSTDLNNYMDITESSIDVSAPCSDVKSAAGTGVTTPSTIRPDSTESRPELSAPWNGKTMYEDLNNYLDSLLNNSGDSSRHKSSKDDNQNIANYETLKNNSSSQTAQDMILSSGFTQAPKSLNSNPLPLTSPPGSLQSRIMAESTHPTTPTKVNTENLDGCSNFLQDCALSPVVKSDLQNSYEQKVQLYLQNLVKDQAIAREISEGTMLPNQPQNQEKEIKVPLPKLGSMSSKNLINGTSTRMNSEGNVNGYLEAPPRLVRSNSYTLDSPSPMLLAHMEAELKKNVRNELVREERAQVSHNNAPARRVWDVESMPSWCKRDDNIASNKPKIQSPKKMPIQSISSVSSPTKISERVQALSDLSSKSSKGKVANRSSDNTKVRKSGKGYQQENTEGTGDRNSQEIGSALIEQEDSRDKVRALLLKVQLQHNQEMEELLNRQRKEKEAIRLALLKEQTVNALKKSQETVPRSVLSHTSANNQINTLSQSPPTKDKALLMERRNTSPSIYDKENADELHSCLLQFNKSSSISLDDVINSGDKAPLIDFEYEEKTEIISKATTSEPKASLSTVMTFSDNMVVPKSASIAVSSDSINLGSDMIASFPPGDLPNISHPENMTSSLPSEILSLHFSNTEFTIQNLNTVSCKAQSSSVSFNQALPVSTCTASLTQNVLSSVFAPSVSGGSPHSKRRSWCSRQLFPDDFDWVTKSQEIQKHLAAAKIQAGIRGYLTRRLLKTERVQNCITTIRDTIVCALQLQRDCAPHVEPSDLQLHGRLIQQLSAACEELHNIFMGIPVDKRMAIIASDRERLRTRTPRSRTSTGSRPLSRATQIVLQRKLNQTDRSDSGSIYSRSSSANRSRRRSWAVESRSRQSYIPSSAANNCEVIPGCLSRSSVPTSHPLQRSASAGSSRKPWR